jgi:hypothetical protein
LGLGANGIVKNNYFGIVLVVFGGLSLCLFIRITEILRDIQVLKNFGLTTHLQRMIGVLLLFTAFIVVNNTFTT